VNTEPSAEDLDAVRLAVRALPPMSAESLDRIAALWASMDAQASDARRRAVTRPARPAHHRLTPAIE